MKKGKKSKTILRAFKAFMWENSKTQEKKNFPKGYCKMTPRIHTITTAKTSSRLGAGSAEASTKVVISGFGASVEAPGSGASVSASTTTASDSEDLRRKGNVGLA